MNIAERVITKLGGVRVVAKVVGRDPSQVHRWKYPKGYRGGGRGGIVPAEHQQALLDYARANGIDLTPDDFFDLEGAA